MTGTDVMMYHISTEIQRANKTLSPKQLSILAFSLFSEPFNERKGNPQIGQAALPTTDLRAKLKICYYSTENYSTCSGKARGKGGGECSGSDPHNIF